MEGLRGGDQDGLQPGGEIAARFGMTCRECCQRIALGRETTLAGGQLFADIVERGEDGWFAGVGDEPRRGQRPEGAAVFAAELQAEVVGAAVAGDQLSDALAI